MKTPKYALLAHTPSSDPSLVLQTSLFQKVNPSACLNSDNENPAGTACPGTTAPGLTMHFLFLFLLPASSKFDTLKAPNHDAAKHEGSERLNKKAKRKMAKGTEIPSSWDR